MIFPMALGVYLVIIEIVQNQLVFPVFFDVLGLNEFFFLDLKVLV